MPHQINKDSCLVIEKEMLTKTTCFHKLTQNMFLIIRKRSLQENIAIEDYEERLEDTKNIITRLGNDIFTEEVSHRLNAQRPVLSHDDLSNSLTTDSNSPFERHELEAVAFEYRNKKWMQSDDVDLLLIQYCCFHEILSYKAHLTTRGRLKKEPNSIASVIGPRFFSFIFKFLGYFLLTSSVCSLFTADLLQLFFVSSLLSFTIVLTKPKKNEKEYDLILLENLLALVPFLSSSDFNPVILEHFLTKNSIMIPSIGFALVCDQKSRFLKSNWRMQKA